MYTYIYTYIYIHMYRTVRDMEEKIERCLHMSNRKPRD